MNNVSSRCWCSNPDEVLKSGSPNRNRTTPASNRIISGYSEVLSLRWWQATFCLFRKADMVCFIYIYKVVLSVCSHPLVGRVSRRRTLRSTGMRPLCEWKLIQTKKPCARCGTSGRFSPFFCRVPNPPPKYTDEAANVNAVTFFFCRVPNRRQQTCNRSFSTSPCTQQSPAICALAAEAWPARKRSLEREDVLKQTINPECMATWEKSEFRNELLRNGQLPSIPARHWSGAAEDEHGQTFKKFSWSREHTEANRSSAHG